MIQPYTWLKVADNSGAKKVRCFNIGKLSKHRFARLGDVVTASVRVCTPNSNIKKKEIVKAVIVRQKSPYLRPDGSSIRFDDNAVVLINPDKIPRGTRVLGPIAREIRDQGFAKIASLAQELL